MGDRRVGAGGRMKVSPLTSHLIEQGRKLIQTLPGSSCEPVMQMRKDALARLESTGLPKMTDEQWRYTNIRSLEKFRFDFARQSVSALDNVDFGEGCLSGTETYRIVFVDGWFSPKLSKLDNLPKTVQFRNLADVLDSPADGDPEFREFALRELQRMAIDAEHGFTAVGAGFAADGLVIRVGVDTKVDRPLEVICLSCADANSRFSNINGFIHMEQGAEIQFVERYVSSDNTSHLTNSSFVFELEADARVDHYRVQNESESAFHIGSATTRQADCSQYRIFSGSFGALLNRHEVTPSLDGKNSHCELKGLYIGAGNQHIDNYTTIAHESADATSNEFYKGILDDSARAVFHGRIRVAPGAQHTDAQQQNRSLLLSPNAEADTKPQLEIYADDVKCSHGATIGQLDESAVFYLRSRGLEKAQARALLTHAFAQEILRDIKLAPVQAEVSDLVRKKLNLDMSTREAA